MDDKSYHVRIPKRWVRIALIVGATALVVAPLTAVATHSFTDVPNDNTFHADIEWLKDADVTRGCNPPANTRYCPKDNVTREQMSAFMRRLAENQVVDAATAVVADIALSLPDDLVSAVFEARTNGYVNLPNNVNTTIQTLTLPPGNYLVLARADLNNNAGNVTTPAGQCSITAGSRTVTFDIPGMFGGSGPGDRYAFTEQFVHAFNATGEVALACTPQGWSGNAGRPTITAVSAPGGVAIADIAAGAQGTGE